MAQQNISTVVWLCAKKKFTQSDGVEGVLTFDGADFSFLSSDKKTHITISGNDLAVADLNNILGSSQFGLQTITGRTYIFSVARPIDNKAAIKRSLYGNRLPGNSSVTGNLEQAVKNAKLWRQGLVEALPASKIKVRNEIRLGFIVVVTIVVLAVFFGTALLVLNIVAA